MTMNAPSRAGGFGQKIVMGMARCAGIKFDKTPGAHRLAALSSRKTNPLR
jgi:hypothetical protein